MEFFENSIYLWIKKKIVEILLSGIVEIIARQKQFRFSRANEPMM